MAYFRRDQILVVISSLEIATKVTQKVAQIDSDRVGRVDCHKATEKPKETSCLYESSAFVPIRQTS